MRKTCTKIGLFLPPTFSLMAAATVAETFNLANELAGDIRFHVTSIGYKDQPLTSYSKMTMVPDCAYQDSEDYDWVVICGSAGASQFRDEDVFQWLRRMDRKGVTLGAITSGSWILARAGLLDGYRCTVHWQEAASFREEFPNIPLTDTLYEIDGRRFTCEGGLGTLDLVISYLSSSEGEQFAHQVNHRMINDRIRQEGKNWDGSHSARQKIRNVYVRMAVELMETHLEDPLPIADIADLIKTSPRNLSRLFQTHLGLTPQQFYLQTRLQQAWELLDQTSLSIREVALATGFPSPRYFSDAFKAQFGYPPSHQRKKKL